MGVVHYGYATIHPAYYFLHTSPLTQVPTNRVRARIVTRTRFVLKERALTAVRVQRLCGQLAEEQGGI